MSPSYIEEGRAAKQEYTNLKSEKFLNEKKHNLLSVLSRVIPVFYCLQDILQIYHF